MTAAVTSVTRLNAAASRIALAASATGATDVTGFALLGHLGHLGRMVSESSVDVELAVDEVPFLRGAGHQAAVIGNVGDGTGQLRLR